MSYAHIRIEADQSFVKEFMPSRVKPEAAIEHRDDHDDQNDHDQDDQDDPDDHDHEKPGNPATSRRPEKQGDHQDNTAKLPSTFLVTDSEARARLLPPSASPSHWWDSGARPR